MEVRPMPNYDQQHRPTKETQSPLETPRSALNPHSALIQRKMAQRVQRKKDGDGASWVGKEADDGESVDPWGAEVPDANGILDDGEKALAAGKPETEIIPLEPWNVANLEFKDPAVQRLLIHLITTWLGEAESRPLMEVPLDQDASTPQVPKWVHRFRMKVLMGNKKDAVDAQRKCALATKLADAVQEKTDGDKFREEFLKGVHAGTPIMSQAEIDAANKNLKGKGKFTTCISYAGSKVNEALAKKPGAKKFLGPNAYKEADPQAKLSASDELPPGSWKDAKTAAEPPKPGDMLIITFAEKTDIGEGDKKITAQIGWFAHTNILRAIGPVDENDPDLKVARDRKKIDGEPDQTWYTVDGSSTTSTDGKEFYSKAHQRLDSRHGKRFIKGWYDIACMAGYTD